MAVGVYVERTIKSVRCSAESHSVHNTLVVHCTPSCPHSVDALPCIMSITVAVRRHPGAAAAATASCIRAAAHHFLRIVADCVIIDEKANDGCKPPTAIRTFNQLQRTSSNATAPPAPYTAVVRAYHISSVGFIPYTISAISVLLQ